jgi:hypothetical protein
MEATHADKIAAGAERILKLVRHTRYQGEPVVNPKTGTYEVDGGGFLGLVLETVAPEQLARMPKSSNERYPHAFDVYEFCTGHLPQGWRRVLRLEDVQRGDVIAWGRAGKAAGGHDAAHVLVAAQAPAFHKASHVWSLYVYDSSDVAHYDDSREKDGKHHSGIGAGTVRFRVDSSGVPAAVQLGPDADFHSHPIAIVRLEEVSDTKTKPAHKTDERAAPGNAQAASPGLRVARAATANDTLQAGEYAIATYVLASNDAMLLVPTTIAYWGPGQTIAGSVGRGSSTYNLAGGVVFGSE